MARPLKEVTEFNELCDDLAAVLLGQESFVDLCDEWVYADDGWDQQRFDHLCNLAVKRLSAGKRYIKQLRKVAVALQMRFEGEDAD